MRNKDNWLNSYDYLKNQILIYNYINPEHIHILKLKFWILDGELSIEEQLSGLKDDNIYEPKNHYESLINELSFLDKYIRTKDKKLEKNEENFMTFVSNRKNDLMTFKRQKNEITGEYNKDWEMLYNSRLTLLTNNQFQELYELYKIKELSEGLDNAFDILYKVSNDNIDKDIFNQELSIDRYQSPEEMELMIKNTGILEKKREDDNLIKEMNIFHEEIISIVIEIIPPLPEPPLAFIENPEYDENDPLSEPSLPNPITWNDSKIIIMNFPTIREYVNEEKNHSSHKGMIVEQMQQGGYRYTFKSISDLKSPELINLSDVIVSGSSKYNQVEWNFDDWEYAHYYEEVNSETGQSQRYIVGLGVTKNNLSINNLERFNELNKRWTNLNRLREDIIQNTGTRMRLESMFDAEIQDMKPDMIDHLEDKKEQKENTINILKERVLFGEFI